MHILRNDAEEGIVPTMRNLTSQRKVTIIQSDFRFFMYLLPEIYLLFNMRFEEVEPRFSRGIQ
jgi:hypothetical protein